VLLFDISNIIVSIQFSKVYIRKNNNIVKSKKLMIQTMKVLSIEDQTYKRLTFMLEQIMHDKKRDVNYDDIINELIDAYQENIWGHIGAEAGGGR
jgi:hypothetical protein